MHSDNSNTKTSQRDGQIHAPRVLASAVADSDKGTQSSNTVPSTCITDGFTSLLRTSIDSLYVTYQGELSDLMSMRLTQLKAFAQSQRDSSANLSQIRLGKHLFEVSGNGRHPFAFILSDAYFRIEIAKQGAKHTPLVHCKIASEYLSLVCTDAIIKDLHEIVGSLGTITGASNISRADLCVDFVTNYPIAGIKNPEWVTKARSFSDHFTDRRYSGVSIASGSALSARLYSKTIEMKKNPRPYLEAIWRSLGWDGCSEVWRLEFQFRRQALKGLSVVTYADLMTSLRGLWQYCTEKWLRHTIPNDSDKTQSRWPLSPLWEVLQRAEWQGEKHLERVNLVLSKAPSDQFLFVNGLSPLTSFMARDGYDDAGEAILAFFQGAQDFHNGNAHETGVDFENYILAKLSQKRKAYGTAKNQPIGGDLHPDDKLVADEYRKRSNGDY